MSQINPLPLRRLSAGYWSQQEEISTFLGWQMWKWIALCRFWVESWHHSSWMCWVRKKSEGGFSSILPWGARWTELDSRGRVNMWRGMTPFIPLPNQTTQDQHQQCSPSHASFLWDQDKIRPRRVAPVEKTCMVWLNSTSERQGLRESLAQSSGVSDGYMVLRV